MDAGTIVGLTQSHGPETAIMVGVVYMLWKLDKKFSQHTIKVDESHKHLHDCVHRVDESVKTMSKEVVEAQKVNERQDAMFESISHRLDRVHDIIREIIKGN